MTAKIGHTRQLVDFALDVYKNGLPEQVEKKMTELIIDQIGLQVACVRYPWSEAVHKYMTTFSTPGKSTVVYFGDKLSPEQAAFANGAFGHGQDYDDTVMKVQTHPGAVVIPVGLAMGEEVGANGRDVLNAIAAGMEVMLRVAHSVSPYCLSSGVHTPPAARSARRSSRVSCWASRVTSSSTRWASQVPSRAACWSTRKRAAPSSASTARSRPRPASARRTCRSSA